MRYQLLFLSVLLAAEPALAQRAPAAQPAAFAATPAVPDTAAALHRLFAGHRQRRNFIAAGLGLGLLAGTAGSIVTAEESSSASRRNILDLDSAPAGSAGSAASQSSASSGSAGATGWLLCVVFTAPLIAADYVVYAGYSRKLEKKAEADYEAGHLSNRLRKRLRAKYFRPVKAS